jgi:xyloglucan-specific endo-beta-1,4-glucanase
VSDSKVVQRGTPTVRDATSVQETISLCTQYAYHAANGYEILNNLWGKDSATSGSQCTYYEGTSGSGIKWSSTWTWQGAENNVKSYVYAGRQVTKGNTIAKIKNMPTQIDWSYNTTNNVRANVAYDIFTASDPDHVNSSGDYELMIWYVCAPRREFVKINITQAWSSRWRMAHLTRRVPNSHSHYCRIQLRPLLRLQRIDEGV